ncbi:hypothetical protein BU15DRAFT_66915 [Melanogaster broomeanus]|nr:hypothetical protein BU15DRAFT_66915 [Melanogaster broomeanus]
MSLFKWSNSYASYPNEIYLNILEYIAPTSARLTLERLKTFTNLCLVCRFFGNICLPRVFEHVEFSEFNDITSLAIRGSPTSRGMTLCQHIADKEPLALALAPYVKTCHLKYWFLSQEGSPELRVLSQMYLTAVAQMKNIRELGIFYSNVKIAHWDVITTLESLQELCFDSCNFSENPADLNPAKKVKVPCLKVLRCLWELTIHLRPLTAAFAHTCNGYDE